VVLMAHDFVSRYDNHHSCTNAPCVPSSTFVLHTRTRGTRLAARAWATCFSCTFFSVSETIACKNNKSTASTSEKHCIFSG
jgi:hypothetical protein